MENATARPEPLLVGRQRELALLWGQFEAAAGGRSRAPWRSVGS